MSLRSFSRLLTRSFYPRKMKVESSPGIVSQAASMLVAGRPARSLHTIRGVGAGGSTYGALAAAALTGGAGMLIFKKRPDDDEPVDGDVTMEDMKDVDNKPRQEDIKKEVDINKDMGKHQMDVDMEAKFHKWMEWMGREYPNQEEKAYRFELFKERMKQLDIEIAGRVKNPLPNGFGDMTDDEIRAITNCHKPRSKEYEASLMKSSGSLMKTGLSTFEEEDGEGEGEKECRQLLKAVMQLATSMSSHD
ncbi:hypothetical protein U9M48_037739 [Paspalum notatum var. saurae]|uniref:Cathepsin propeptide inhibitor domain-containing protein n=1 Tax=Paspalum notatum var. saurae TaxID=547442 RepID=A0AAQ3UFN1_PASNO